MGQLKNTTDVCWGCILVECVQATCHFLRGRLHWKGVYQGAHGWAIIGELQLQRKMVQSNDSLRFKLANYNCLGAKYTVMLCFVVVICFIHHTSRKNMLVQKKILGSACQN